MSDIVSLRFGSGGFAAVPRKGRESVIDPSVIDFWVFNFSIFICVGFSVADLDEQAQDRCRLIIRQMATAEGVTEELKHQSQWE